MPSMEQIALAVINGGIPARTEPTGLGRRHQSPRHGGHWPKTFLRAQRDRSLSRRALV